MVTTGGWGSFGRDYWEVQSLEGPNEDVINGSKKAFLRKWHMLTKSDHKSVEIDISRNNTHDKIAQGATLLKCDLREPKKKATPRRQSMQAGWYNKTMFLPSPLT